MAADGGLSDITSLLQLVKSQPTTTTSSTNLSQAGVTQQIQDILQGTSGLASVAGAQHSAGLYNGSTNTLLTNDLLARATAQVAAKNATTTTTQKKAPLLSAQNVEGILASAALKKAVGGKGIIQNSKDAYNSVADELGFGPNSDANTDSALDSVSSSGPGAQVGDFTSFEDSIDPANGFGADSADTSGDELDDAFSSSADGDKATAQSVSNNAGGTDDTDESSSLGDTSSVSQVNDVSNTSDAVSGVSDADTDATIASSASSTNDVAGLDTIDDASYASDASDADDLGTASDAVALDETANPVIGEIGAAIDDYNDFSSGNTAESIGDVVGGNWVGTAVGSWIVCTELLRQEKFERTHYISGLRVFQSYPHHLLEGYYIWAKPLVAHIRKYPNGFACKFAKHVFGHRAEYLAARAGIAGANDTVYGQCISASMFAGCFVLGHAINFASKFTSKCSGTKKKVKVQSGT